MNLQVGQFWGTRFGDKAEIIWVGERGNICAVAFIGNLVVDYFADGRSCTNSNDDLIEPWCEPVKIEGWVNYAVEGDAVSGFYQDETEAIRCGVPDDIQIFVTGEEK